VAGPPLIPLFILGVPIVDMAFAFVRRTAKGTQFHSPDKDHIHHRLLRLGHGPRRTVVILWGWTAVLSGFVLVPLYFPAGNSFIPLGAAVLVLSLYTWFHPGLRKHDPEPGDTNGFAVANSSGGGESSNGSGHDPVDEPVPDPANEPRHEPNEASVRFRRIQVPKLRRKLLSPTEIARIPGPATAERSD
jgi:hypothetical protein